MTTVEMDRAAKAYERMTEQQPHMMTLLIGVMGHLATPALKTARTAGEWVAGYTLLGHYPPNTNQNPLENPYVSSQQNSVDRGLPLTD